MQAGRGRKEEREKRRRIKDAGLYLGHMANNHMTVIILMESYKNILQSVSATAYFMRFKRLPVKGQPLYVKKFFKINGGIYYVDIYRSRSSYSNTNA